MALPNREQLLKVLRREREAAPRTLANLLGVTKKDLTAFKRLLRELKKEGALENAGRKKLSLPAARLRGEFIDTGRAFAFIHPIPPVGADVFIHKWAKAGARDGDIVEYEVTRPDRNAGRVFRVIERLPEALGLVAQRGTSFVLLPFRRTMEEVELVSVPAGLAAGAIVRATLEHARGERVGRVDEVLGDVETDGIEERVILEMHKRPVEFSPKSLAEAGAYPETPDSGQIHGRADLRDRLCFTIDPDDARDFDDAVSLAPAAGGTTQILGVHIADVSAFVRPGTALDSDARSRGCSVYFPRGVIPMLPQRLSSDLCSLRAGVDRLAFSVMMEVNGEGEVIRAEFTPSVIRSAARLTYSQAQAIIDGEPFAGPPTVAEPLRRMRDLADRMFRRRRRQGSLDFDLPEPVLHFDTDGDLVHVSPYPRLASHRLVEEFMLAANQAVAEYLHGKEVPTLYRVHEPPDPGKVEELNEILEIFRLPPIHLPDAPPRDFQRAIDESSKRPQEKFLIYRILRALMLARYSTENLGHFGLAKDFYLHFTSPIRRYPDLLVHRALRAALAGGGSQPVAAPLDLLADSTSRLERDAEEIEREIVAWKIAVFFRRRLGEVYDGTVIGFSAHHVIVELDSLYVEVKVRIDSLPGRWELDPGYDLKSGKKRIRLADRVKVQVAAVDMRRREAVFLLVSPR